MPKVRAIFGIAMAALLLALFLGSPAEARGVVWCVKDPIFEIDGRVVTVQDLVPIEQVNTPIHFVLRIAEDSRASWRLPVGETLLGSVTIVRDDDISRDTPRLSVRGEGPSFPMRVQVSGSGLRTAAYEVQGTSRGMTVSLRLVALPRANDDDD